MGGGADGTGAAAAVAGRLEVPRLPDGVPDVRDEAKRIASVVRLRQGTQFHGLLVTKEIVVAAFKRIVAKRGHLFAAKETLLPVDWLRAAALSLHQYLAGSNLYTASPEQSYFWMQGLWGS